TPQAERRRAGCEDLAGDRYGHDPIEGAHAVHHGERRGYDREPCGTPQAHRCAHSRARDSAKPARLRVVVSLPVAWAAASVAGTPTRCGQPAAPPLGRSW